MVLELAEEGIYSARVWAELLVPVLVLWLASIPLLLWMRASSPAPPLSCVVRFLRPSPSMLPQSCESVSCPALCLNYLLPGALPFEFAFVGVPPLLRLRVLPAGPCEGALHWLRVWVRLEPSPPGSVVGVAVVLCYCLLILLSAFFFFWWWWR